MWQDAHRNLGSRRMRKSRNPSLNRSPGHPSTQNSFPRLSPATLKKQFLKERKYAFTQARVTVPNGHRACHEKAWRCGAGPSQKYNVSFEWDAEGNSGIAACLFHFIACHVRGVCKAGSTASAVQRTRDG